MSDLDTTIPENEANDNSPFVILPFGATFKPLLVEASLTDKDLNSLLQSRGIFVGPKRKTKADSISVLASSLLSPSEFSKLSEKQRGKETKSKYSTAQAEWIIQKTSLISAMPDDLEEFVRKLIDDNDEFCIQDCNCSVQSADEFSIEVIIKRRDWKKDALSNTNYHNCSVTIRREGDLLKIETERTVAESKRLVESLRKGIFEHLKKEGCLNNSTNLRRIMSDSFVSNEQVFVYLISFLEFGFQHLTYDRMLNVLAGIDSKKKFPENLDWVKRDIEEISMSGSNIKNTDLIKAGEAGALMFGEIEAEYSFSYVSASGKCVIRYGFPRHFSGKRKFKNVEFEAKVIKVVRETIFDTSTNDSSLERAILVEFQSQKYILHDRLIATAGGATVDTSRLQGGDSRLDLFEI